jgi:RHH-type transcriptional regulator, proline utilization regulon repressor / proline dehydrogenase / delta 1-pyrroline-5-carboxylate dehydrogenase
MSARPGAAACDGAILPRIQDRTDGSYDLTRLVMKKAASINTTAAGGNASLMSWRGSRAVLAVRVRL